MTLAGLEAPTFEDVQLARQRQAAYVDRTPLIASADLSALCGRE